MVALRVFKGEPAKHVSGGNIILLDIFIPYREVQKKLPHSPPMRPYGRFFIGKCSAKMIILPVESHLQALFQVRLRRNHCYK